MILCPHTGLSVLFQSATVVFQISVGTAILTDKAALHHVHNTMGVQGSIKGGLKEAKGSAKVGFIALFGRTCCGES